MSAGAFLRAWGAIAHDVTSLVDAALDVEPPGGVDDAWAAWLARCGVTPLDDDTRYGSLKANGQVKGAPLDEVRACLEALAKQATLTLAPLRRTLTPPQAALVDAALHELAATAFAQARAKATERKKRMFAHAKQLAEQHRYDEHATAKGYVLGCGTCGAPRLGETLSCAFCGADLG